MKYRTDIDGLRGVSILIILFFHAGFHTIQSGFVSVDVFFVISGFLISSNIIRDLDAGKFSLATFYKRRFLRLSPVLIALIVVTFCIATYFYLPDDYVTYARSAMHTMIFNSNSYFARTTGGYFDSDSNFLLLLHTWSLSIEWKWYLLLPILLLITYRSIPRKWLSLVIFLLFLMSMIYSMYGSYRVTGIEKHYYSLSSRIFELLMGAMLVFFPYKKINVHRNILSVVGILAILTIIGTALTKNVGQMFPNYYAILVVISAATLIAIGALDAKNLASRLLSLKLVVFIGTISYSLYIWHWPIFSLLRYLSIKETNVVTATAIGLSILLGYLSWKFLEQTTRYLIQLKFLIVISVLFIVPTLITYYVTEGIKKHDGYYSRFNSNEGKNSLLEIKQAEEKYFLSGRNDCIVTQGMANYEGDDRCFFGSEKSDRKTALLIGDSFANQQWGFLGVLAKDANIRIESNTHSACLMLTGVYLTHWIDVPNGLHQSCADVTKKQYEKIESNHYNYIIFGQVWSYYFVDNVVNKADDERSYELGEKRYRAALMLSIQKAVDAGSIPVLFDETYVDLKNADNKCTISNVKLRKKSSRNCSLMIKFTENERKSKGLLLEMQKKYPQLLIIDPKLVQCPDNQCKTEINNIPIYRNGAHITDHASYEFGLRYLKEFGNPFLNKL